MMLPQKKQTSKHGHTGQFWQVLDLRNVGFVRPSDEQCDDGRYKDETRGRMHDEDRLVDQDTRENAHQMFPFSGILLQYVLADLVKSVSLEVRAAFPLHRLTLDDMNV